MKVRRQTVGFTIVELLIVIVVIAILAAITIVSYNGISNRAETAKFSAQVSKWTKILQSYKVIAGKYPYTASSGIQYVCLGGTYEATADFPADRCYSYVDTSLGINTDGGFIYNSDFNALLKTVTPNLPNEKVGTTIMPYNGGTIKIRGLLYTATSDLGRLSYVIKSSEQCAQGTKDSSYAATSGTATCNIDI